MKIIFTIVASSILLISCFSIKSQNIHSKINNSYDTLKIVRYYLGTNAKMEEGLSLNGRKIDKWSYWDSSGNIISEDVYFKDSVKSIDYYPSGFIESIEITKMCPLMSIEIDENFDSISRNKLIKEHEPFNDSARVIAGTFVRYYENGNIKIIEEYFHGYTLFISKYDLDDPYSSREYVVPIKNGVWKYFSELGKLEKEIHYKMGKELNTVFKE